MAPVDLTTIQEKLGKLRTVVDKLEQLRQTPADQFIEEFRLSDAALHNLVVGIEVIIDIGNHILSEVFQMKADSYATVIHKLGETKVIPQDFAAENAEMAKFRNLIIHEYGAVNLGRVYEYLQKAPNVFRQFAQHFNTFLQQKT